MRTIYVEDLVGMAYSVGAAVWSFDPALWGTCAQGRTAPEAVARWTAEHGAAEIVETIRGDEQAFRRDLAPASDDELERTLATLAAQRQRTRRLLHSLPAEQLDHDDPNREMPSWARRRTIRATMWHICDTESRYYLLRTGQPSRDRAGDLAEELTASQRHVRTVLLSMPRDAVHRSGGELWTTTKLLRRLAWHERGELDAITELLSGRATPDGMR